MKLYLEYSMYFLDSNTGISLANIAEREHVKINSAFMLGFVLGWAENNNNVK